MNEKRLIVSGSRTWTDLEVIRSALKQAHAEGYRVLIHGGARGTDRFASDIGKSIGFRISMFPADWDKHGKAAGAIRNLQMLDEGNADLLIAFHKDSSRGTAHMISITKAAGLEIRVFEA